jgi:undecaprenyl diphosphate synthase
MMNKELDMLKSSDEQLDYRIPKHIAFIMDGNGRWAKEKNKKRTFGHKEGSNTLKKICEDCFNIGVEYITVYAFSTENWKRPKDEVDYLMHLMRQYLKDSIKTSKKDNMRIRVIGDINNLPGDIIDSINKLHVESSNNTGLKLQIAINYGGRDEIIRGIKKVVNATREGKMTVEDINESFFSSYLDTHEIPDPDLMIRTSGEMRLSNFLLWQLAYSEFYFCKKYWPDLTIEDVKEAIKVYNKVDRRYGGIS